MTKDQDSAQSRPKRTRRQVDQVEPAQAPASSTGIAASVKRRRLNGTDPKPASKAPAAPSTSRASSNKPNAARHRSTKSKPPDKGTQATQSVYDLPGSSEDEGRSRLPPNLGPPAIKYKKMGLKAPKAQPAPVSKSVYEPPDSDDDLSKDTEQPTSSRGRAGTAAPKPSQGRRVATAIAAGKKSGQEDAGDDKPKRRGRPPKAKEPAEAPSSRKDPVASRLAKSAAHSPSRQEAPKLKGILTPQKKVMGRPRKNVAFGGGKNGHETEVFFEDLPSKSKNSGNSKKPGKAQAEEEQASEDGESENDGDDDEVCAICLKPDSEPPNEIIFCENCDMAVHQECYNVPVIPEGDWICRNCSQEDVLSGDKSRTSVSKTPSEVVAAGIPDIPNFEQHLHTMQRVLLDRCTGNRRIKLQGQSEAYEKAFQLVEQTVLAGEGNSMMVIGARGCGKTAV